MKLDRKATLLINMFSIIFLEVEIGFGNYIFNKS